MTATDTYALAGALALGALSLLHGLVWRVQRERWAACFAVGFMAAALVYAFDEHTRPHGDLPNLYSGVVALLLVTLTTLGLIDYFSITGRAASGLAVGVLGTSAVMTVLMALGAVNRLTAFAVYGVLLSAQGLMACYAMRVEPRSGHGLVAATLLLYPGVIGAAALGWLPVPLLRYLLIVPTAAVGATVLTTGLLRAQRRAQVELQGRQAAEQALQALNESLEQRVAQRTAELHEMVSALESFNRSVSHDLRGPLGGIAGVSRLATEALARDDRSTVHRMLEVITTQADSSAKLVGALLALARVGDVPLHAQSVDLDAFVRDTLEQMRLADPQNRPPPVTVQTLPRVHADPDLLRQVVVNLVGNAMKFTRDSHPPRIEVGALQPTNTPGSERVLYVRDNGVGFDMDEATQLFQPFEQLQGPQRAQGHGVGLSIVKRIVERHGGKVWAESARNRGATFYFSLPA